MNARERFLANMHFQATDRLPRWEWHFLPDTVERWHTEGLPSTVVLEPSGPAESSLADYLGLDRGQPYCQGCTELVPVNTGMLPEFPVRILEEDEHRQLLYDRDGAKKLILKHITPMMPQFLDFPVHNRHDFNELVSRYNPDSPERYPADWSTYVARATGRDYPLGLAFDGYVGRLRSWMGLEGLCYMLADEPGLLVEMCEFHTEFILRTIERALDDLTIDYVNIWEDMAYKAGSLISPRFVREVMLPGYKRLCTALRGHGIDIIFVDCDGNIDELIPIWLEGGINGIWPLEAAAGMNPNALRRHYGRELLMVGGIDKRRLSKGTPDVLAEAERISTLPLADGGYIPTVDHSVPPDVPWSNYLALRQSLAGFSPA